MMKYLPHLHGFPEWVVFLFMIFGTLMVLKLDGKRIPVKPGEGGTYVVFMLGLMGLYWWGGFWDTFGIPQFLMAIYTAWRIWNHGFNPHEYTVDAQRGIIMSLGEAIVLKFGGFW